MRLSVGPNWIAAAITLGASGIAVKWPDTGTSLMLAAVLVLLAGVRINGWHVNFHWVDRNRLTQVGIGIASIVIIWGIVQIWTIKSNYEAYVLPRTLTSAQADEIKKVLSAHETHLLTIKVHVSDPEALEYGAQLFNAFHAVWDDTKFFPSDDNPPFSPGLCVSETGTLKKPNDKKHDPKAIVEEAFRAANVFTTCGGSAAAGDYELSLLVGHRPLKLISGPPLLARLGWWLIRVAGS